MNFDWILGNEKFINKFYFRERAIEIRSVCAVPVLIAAYDEKIILIDFFACFVGMKLIDEDAGRMCCSALILG